MSSSSAGGGSSSSSFAGGGSSSAAVSSTALVAVPNADRTQLSNYGTDVIRSGEVEVEVQWRHSSGAEIKFQ